MRESDKIIIKHFIKPIVGAEIGVAIGEHAKVLLSEIPNLHLHLIDDASEKDGQLREIGCELREIPIDRITWHKKTSVEAVKDFEDNSLDFVYIDADHHYEPALQDCSLWYPKVKVGGIICGHDFNCKAVEVKRAVTEFFGNLKKEINSANNIDDWVPCNRPISDWWVFK